MKWNIALEISGKMSRKNYSKNAKKYLEDKRYDIVALYMLCEWIVSEMA